MSTQEPGGETMPRWLEESVEEEGDVEEPFTTPQTAPEERQAARACDGTDPSPHSRERTRKGRLQEGIRDDKCPGLADTENM